MYLRTWMYTFYQASGHNLCTSYVFYTTTTHQGVPTCTRSGPVSTISPVRPPTELVTKSSRASVAGVACDTSWCNTLSTVITVLTIHNKTIRLQLCTLHSHPNFPRRPKGWHQDCKSTHLAIASERFFAIICYIKIIHLLIVTENDK